MFSRVAKPRSKIPLWFHRGNKNRSYTETVKFSVSVYALNCNSPVPCTSHYDIDTFFNRLASKLMVPACYWVGMVLVVYRVATEK